jgi:hypothetical protein
LISPAKGWGPGIEFIEFIELIELVEFMETRDLYRLVETLGRLEGASCLLSVGG